MEKMITFHRRHSLEEILSISTEAIKTRAPKKCINKSICWHPEGTRGVPMEGAPPVANQIDLFMHFLGDSLDGLVARPVEMDKISSSASMSIQWLMSNTYFPPQRGYI